MTPFFYAAQNGINGWTDTDDKGYMECLKLLAAAGADINTADNCGNTALHISIQRTDFECMSLLMELGADINANNGRYNRYEWSPLHCAMFNNNTEAVRILLDAGADPNITDSSGRTLLHHALRTDVSINTSKGLEYASMLISAGAGLEMKDEDGRTALCRTIQYGQLKQAELLLKAGADTAALDKEGQPVLFLAEKIKFSQLCALLVKYGADINIADTEGNTYLHWYLSLSLKNFDAALSVLRKYNIDLDRKNAGGKTALHIAALQGDMKNIRLLMKVGADPNIKDADGRTPLEILKTLHPEKYKKYEERETSKRITREDRTKSAGTGYEFDI